jgi:hypothetical protein
MSIFSQLYSFCLLEMHFGVVGELIVVWHCCISVTICVQCCRRNFSDNTSHISLAQWEIVIPYGLTTMPYPRPFSSYNFQIPQPNKLLVCIHIIFSKLCIHSPSHFHLFEGTKKNEISLFMYASYQHAKFPKCNSNIS